MPTQTMTGLGSIGAVEYVEPAILTGQPATRASDVWSLGATLHRALAGEGVYGEMPLNDPLLCVRKVLSSRPKISQELTTEETALVERCLAPDPQDRPNDAPTLARELEVLAGSAA